MIEEWSLQEADLEGGDEALEGSPFSSDVAVRYPLRILVAEDDEANRRIVHDMLKRYGYEPDVAVDGLSVISIADSAAYDLVLMDVQMPGVDGFEATRQIRNRGHVRPRILAMTATVTTVTRERCLAAGFDGFLFKPVRPEHLREALIDAATRVRSDDSRQGS